MLDTRERIIKTEIFIKYTLCILFFLMLLEKHNKHYLLYSRKGRT